MANRQHVRIPAELQGGRAIAIAAVILVSLLAWMVVAPSNGGWEVRGIVTEEGTHKPITGAQVLVTWSGNYIRSLHGSWGCFEVLGATTDLKGFSVPAWRKDLPGVDINEYEINVYARGYGSVTGEISSHHSGGVFAHLLGALGHTNAIKLPPATMEVRGRLSELAHMRIAVRCSEAGASRRNAVDFYRSMNEELSILAATPEGRSIAAEQAPEIARSERVGGPMLSPVLVIGLRSLIESLQSPHDGELYEPAAKPVRRSGRGATLPVLGWCLVNLAQAIKSTHGLRQSAG
ncbi:MAG: hypothetical protein JSR18_05285 [Proteobacteria bacterium]|nr:hypothetical protein [Pseudomonadota bacterium]